MNSLTIIDHANETIECEGLKIVGYSDTLGFYTDFTTVKKIQEGNHSTRTLEFIERLYYMVFVTGTETY